MCSPPRSADENWFNLNSCYMEDNFSNSSGGDLQRYSNENFSNNSGSESENDLVLCNEIKSNQNDPIWTDDQLIEKVKYGDIVFLEFWFRQGFHFNPSMQQEVLLVCCEKENLKLLTFLLENKHITPGLFLDFPSDDNKQKLWGMITDRHDKEMAELLLNFGLSPLLIDGTNIALQYALKAKDVEILILLKKKFGSLDLKGISSHILKDLAKDENIKLLEQLIGKGFDLNRAYPEKKLPFIPLLLRIKYSIMDEVKSLSLFLFALTSSSGPQKQVIKLLLDNGVKPNERFNGDTTISFAVSLQDVELIKMLLAKGAGSDIHLEGENGDTAMSRARLSQNQVIIDLLENPV